MGIPLGNEPRAWLFRLTEHKPDGEIGEFIATVVLGTYQRTDDNLRSVINHVLFERIFSHVPEGMTLSQELLVLHLFTSNPFPHRPPDLQYMDFSAWVTMLKPREAMLEAAAAE
jgi:hypothetical protein